MDLYVETETGSFDPVTEDIILKVFILSRAVRESKHKQEEIHKYAAVPLPNFKVQFGVCVRLHVGGTHSLLGKTTRTLAGKSHHVDKPRVTVAANKQLSTRFIFV